MKKLTSLWVVIMLMTFLGVASIAEARTGSTSSDSSKSSSSSKSRSSGSKTSGGSSSFFSKPSKTDSAFSNAAKTNQARTAWQERNKPSITTPVPSVAVPSNQDSKVEKQLADIQKQLADQKRQQQAIAAAQTAAQIAAQAALNKRPSVTPTPVTPIPGVATNPVNTATSTPVKSESGGGSWFMTLLVIGGIVFVIVWLIKSKSSKTNYRL